MNDNVEIEVAEAAVIEEQVAEPNPMLSKATPQGQGGEVNLDALLDVQVSLSVEIGRCKLPIKELLSLDHGSVVELDRAFDEPLDLLVNGMLIARGEVVVVDGQFGLRLVDIVSQPERLKNLK